MLMLACTCSPLCVGLLAWVQRMDKRRPWKGALFGRNREVTGVETSALCMLAKLSITTPSQPAILTARLQFCPDHGRSHVKPCMRVSSVDLGIHQLGSGLRFINASLQGQLGLSRL